MKTKNILIGAGAFAVIYLLGESKEKKAQKECKVLVHTKFGIKYGFWSPKFFDLTPKLFRKVVTMKEFRKNNKMEVQFIPATINDDRLVTENGVFFKENGKIYKKPMSDLSGVNKVEITISDYQKEIDNYNKLRQKREDDLNSCKTSENGKKMPIKIIK